MTKEKQKIIDEILKNFKPNSHFETEHFIYWVRESYFYNGDTVSREEFKCIKDYVIKHGTLPCMLVPDVKDEKINKLIPRSNHKGFVYGSHDNRVLRYSKTYDSLEMYDHDTSIRAPHNSKIDRILVIAKKQIAFKVNTKNYVLIGGKRWLSLKNWHSFVINSFIKENEVRVLMSTMLGGQGWVENLKEVETISIQNKNSRKASSISEAVNFECGLMPAKVLFKFMSVNQVIKLYRLINPNKIHSITNFIKENSSQIKHLLTNGEESKLLLYYYFLCKDNRCERTILIDYFNMAEEEGEEINLNMSSYVTIKKKHDKISRDILKKKEGGGKLKVAKIYPNIKSTPEMEVEKIKTARRLDHESEMLHHCVHGYKSNINTGYCAIYSLLFNDERYTLQINATKKKKEEDEEALPKWFMTKEEQVAEEKAKNVDDPSEYEFKIAQLKGKFNYDAPEAIKKSLELMCERYDILPLEKSPIRFRTHEVEGMKETKREIIQKGAAILEDLVQGKRVEEARDLAEVNDFPF